MKRCYLVGYPVEHSMSPAMHNAAFKALGIDAEYKLAPVEPGQLGAFIEKLREGDVLGANVTIPHKVEVMRHLDHVDETAHAIGAVNTIVHIDGRLTGYNTDATGGVKALTEMYGGLNGRNVTILGAGGASRAITYQISRVDCRVTVLNRSVEKARKLVDDLRPTASAELRYGGLNQLPGVIVGTDVLINTTPVGMSPKTSDSPVPEELLHGGLFVFDVIYNPIKTKLLKDAEAKGAGTLSGVKMLVYQGAEAFRMWTGVEPPLDIMQRVVEEKLGG
ncbi:MAG TPA: shikimate dehydrogenase [Candidatus Krumholzibacteriaceae bacterium]|nr:shikimate dehydrogenase [Candidatus Krumholzibacteriaceae bacterium]